MCPVQLGNTFSSSDSQSWDILDKSQQQWHKTELSKSVTPCHLHLLLSGLFSKSRMEMSWYSLSGKACFKKLKPKDLSMLPFWGSEREYIHHPGKPWRLTARSWTKQNSEYYPSGTCWAVEQLSDVPLTWLNSSTNTWDKSLYDTHCNTIAGVQTMNISIYLSTTNF